LSVTSVRSFYEFSSTADHRFTLKRHRRNGWTSALTQLQYPADIHDSKHRTRFYRRKMLTVPSLSAIPLQYFCDKCYIRPTPAFWCW